MDTINYMNTSLAINSVIFVLVTSLLANGIAWAFHGDVFMHEFDHHPHALSETQTIHLKLHQHDEFTDDKDSSIIYYCLSSAGQFQPFFFILPPIIPAVAAKEVLAAFTPALIPELILDLPYQPPRNIFPN